MSGMNPYQTPGRQPSYPYQGYATPGMQMQPQQHQQQHMGTPGMTPKYHQQRPGVQAGSMAGMSQPGANVGAAPMVPGKRPNESRTPSKQQKRKRPTDKVLPKKIEAYVPESKLYTELQEFEKKLDSTISRKKLDLLDGLAKPIKTKRTLRVFLSNLASDQYIEMSDLGGAADAFDLESARIPSWTLRIEGRLLDPPGRKPNVTPPKFSSFVKSVIVELDRDSTLYPEGNLIEWHKQPGAPECDGFEVKRRGDSDVNAKILIYLDYAPEKQKLSPELAKLLDLHTDTSSNVIMALWQYVKLHKLQDADDKRFINCDEPLTRILGSAKLPFSSVPDALQRHLFRADPVVLEYTIKVDKEYNMSQFAYDIEVEVDDPIRDKMRSATQPTPVLTRDIGQLDEKIAALVQAINHCKLKRDFMLSFADDPVNFINQWVASQSRDLEVILGDTRVNLEEIRRSDFYAKDSVYEAVFHHLRQKDTQ